MGHSFQIDDQRGFIKSIIPWNGGVELEKELELGLAKYDDGACGEKPYI
jgi:hypothetical protein